MEGIDFGKTFVPVARFEAIRILLAFVASKGFRLYQIDVKSAFLNGVVKEEVFARQPPGFENLSILIEYKSSQKFCTVLSSYHGHGMLGLKHSC
jgi:hypothetical protein